MRDRVRHKPMATQGSSFEYLLSMGDQLGDYVDEWIAVVDSKIVARGKSAKAVYGKAKEVSPDKVPFIMRVPKAQVMVL